MPPGVADASNQTPMVPALAVPATNYGTTTTANVVVLDGDTFGRTENVVIDEEVSPLVSVVVHDDDSVGKSIAPVCRDLPFAILFALHAIIMGWLGIFVAPEGCEQVSINTTFIEEEIRKGDDTTEEDIRQFEEFVKDAAAYVQVYPVRILIFIVVPCCLLAYVFGAISTAFVIKPYPKFAVYSCLIFSILLVVSLLIVGALMSGSVFVYTMTGLALAATIYYVRIAWKMVPFTAVNLQFALEGMGRNSGMYIVAFFFAELGFAWVLYWFYVLVGTAAFENHQCQLDHPNSDFDVDSPDYDNSCEPPLLVTLGFLLSLYWTNTIIMNTVQVTVAGVMATWCFNKTEADGCCSRAIHGSVYRSLTFSFGSICFGSLLQAIVSAFRFLVESARNQRNRDDDSVCGTLLLCILECLARLLEDILEYFNQWAYVFVGVYGYSYLESGRRVLELLRERGFTAIMTDKLVEYVLGFTTCVVAILTGAAGVWIEAVVTRNYGASVDGESYIFGPLPGAGFAFGVSFVVGLWIASVMMNVVKGAVNTLIVCWADSPAVMEMQHPVLTKELVEAWSVVCPTGGFGTPAVIV